MGRRWSRRGRREQEKMRRVSGSASGSGVVLGMKLGDLGLFVGWEGR